MNYIHLQNTKKFARVFGDKNKIHFDKNVAKFFFFREPIVHGVNLTLLALKIFFLNNKFNKFNKIKNLKIDFKNFCTNNEKFIIKIKNNKIIIKNKLNDKIELYVQISKTFFYKSIKLNYFSKKIIKFYQLKKKIFFIIDLFQHLIDISKYVGNFDVKNGTLIHSINLKKIDRKLHIKKIITKKLIKNMYLCKILTREYESEVIFSKLNKLSFDINKFKLNNKLKEKIKSKKIVIFGHSSDVSKAIILCLGKTKQKILSYSLRGKISVNKIKNFLLKNNPDYIFYLSSPRLINEDKINKSLSKMYNEVYYKKFKIIIDILNKNKLETKVFYPSTFALNYKKNYSRIKSYLKAKEKGESLCKRHPYSRFISCYRLPAFKSRSNYNILGFYEGENLHNIKKYLNSFFRK